MDYEKAFKRAMTGLAILLGTAPAIYNAGKDIGYNRGFEDTKTEIRQHVVGTHRMIIDKANDASHFWWITNDTNTVFTRRDQYKFEKCAYDDCEIILDDLINYRINPLTVQNVKESAELDKKYGFR